MHGVDKARLRADLLVQLEAQLAAARAAHAAATEGAIDDEARPENDKDTRGLEQSYLARGHAQRVAELEAAITAVAAMPTGPQTRVAIGALVRVSEDDRERCFYIASHGGGVELAKATVVTPSSPIGRALLGKAVDDECELAAAAGPRTLVIASVQ